MVASVLWQVDDELTTSAPSARTGSAILPETGLHCSRGAFEPHDRQVLFAVMEADFQHDLCPRAAAPQRPGLRARRATRPVRSRFQPRFSIGREFASVDFVGRFPSEPGMRAEFVIPVGNVGQFATKSVASIWHKRQARQNGFQRQNESFDDGDGTVLSNRAIARRLDAFAFAPFAKRRAVELTAAIADDAAGCLFLFKTSYAYGSPIASNRGYPLY